MSSYADTIIKEESQEKIKTISDILAQKLGPNWKVIISLILVTITIVIVIVISL